MTTHCLNPEKMIMIIFFLIKGSPESFSEGFFGKKRSPKHTSLPPPHYHHHTNHYTTTTTLPTLPSPQYFLSCIASARCLFNSLLFLRLGWVSPRLARCTPLRGSCVPERSRCAFLRVLEWSVEPSAGSCVSERSRCAFSHILKLNCAPSARIVRVGALPLCVFTHFLKINGYLIPGVRKHRRHGAPSSGIVRVGMRNICYRAWAVFEVQVLRRSQLCACFIRW